MIFTREDILKIQNALLQLGRKDSEFKDANTPLNSEDYISILQDGINKKVSINNLLSTLGLLKKDDFINVSDRYDEYYIQLSEAITIIAKNKRKKGLVITFQDLKGNWQIYQFTGEVQNFVKTELWKGLFDFKYSIVNSVLPDEEDLTLTYPDSDGNSFIQLKDKEYDPENFSGMATKILRKNIVEVSGVKKNILTQEDFDQENCIYEIRYNFDLNNQTITIPNKCILEFRGGSFQNGTLDGNNYSIQARTKIFSGVKFTGKAARNINFDLDWFVSQYVDDIYEKVSIDSSIEINEAIKSGIHKVVFPNDKYYYLKNPIIVEGDVHLLSKNTERIFDNTYRATLGHCPCVYSNEIITLLDYRFSTTQYQYGLIIGKINFYCRKPYTTLDDKNVPIVQITTADTGSTIWGLNFNADINAVDCEVPVPGSDKTSYVCNYTGLKIYADKSPISYIKINGYVQMVYKAFDIDHSSSQWITDCSINGDTRAVFGGTFNGGTPVRIFGSHQSTYIFADEARFSGYFQSSWINLYGYVWDTGLASSTGLLRTVQYPVQLTYKGLFNQVAQTQPETYGESRYVRSLVQNPNYVQFSNYLDMFYIPSLKSRFNLTYTLNGEDIFSPSENFKLYNAFNVFNTRSLGIPNFKNSYPQLWESNMGFLRISNPMDSATLNFHCEFKSGWFEYQGLLFSSLRVQPGFSAVIRVKAFNGDNLVGEVENSLLLDEVYYTNSYMEYSISKISKGQDISKVTLDIESTRVNQGTGSLWQLPYIMLMTSRYVDAHNYVSDSHPLLSITNSGFSYFNTMYKKQLTNYNNIWYDNQGNPCDAKQIGTTEERPKNITVGFYYFDTTLNKPIWLKSISPKEWVDANGEIV